MKRIEAILDGPFRRGVVTNMPREEYNEACGLNPSSITEKSPKHVKHAYEKPYGESTEPQMLGTVCHTLLWEPHKLDETYAVWDGGRRYGKEWNAFQEEHEGRAIIKRDMLDKACRIADALASDPIVKELASEGIAETAIFTEEFGMQCRGLMDWLNTRTSILCDLKVGHDIEAHVFGGACARFGYIEKMACYRKWFERESGKSVSQVKLIAVESSEPFDVAVVPVDEGMLDWGWERVERRLKVIRKCLMTGEWPGVAKGTEYYLHLPSWAMEEPEELELV